MGHGCLGGWTDGSVPTFGAGGKDMLSHVYIYT